MVVSSHLAAGVGGTSRTRDAGRREGDIEMEQKMGRSGSKEGVGLPRHWDGSRMSQ